MIKNKLNTIRWYFNILSKILQGDKRVWYLNIEKFKDSLYFRFTKQQSSELPIDVLIPVAAKDFGTLSKVVNSVREYVLHPITNIFIVSKESEIIKNFCIETDCIWVDEDKVLPIKKSHIQYKVDGIDRSGWLFQQFIKLTSDTICQNEFVLIIDADTILIRPQRFIDPHGKMIFFFSDEHHQPYYDTYKKLLDCDALSPVSFVSHYMVMNRKLLKSLKEKIEEKNNLVWYEAILKHNDYTQGASFSEYELFGNFAYDNFRGRIKLEYWFNLGLERNKINGYQITEDLRRNYRSLSFHSYDTEAN